MKVNCLQKPLETFMLHELRVSDAFSANNGIILRIVTFIMSSFLAYPVENAHSGSKIEAGQSNSQILDPMDFSDTNFSPREQYLIDEFSEDYIEEFPILDSPETPDSIHPPGLELIGNRVCLKMSKLWEKLQNSFESNNQVSIVTQKSIVSQLFMKPKENENEEIPRSLRTQLLEQLEENSLLVEAQAETQQLEFSKSTNTSSEMASSITEKSYGIFAKLLCFLMITLVVLSATSSWKASKYFYFWDILENYTTKSVPMDLVNFSRV
ncbi:hypothetical protein L3Y34_007323 [Caenorhabditis briggsae]|uniref:Uncharacterized protein n=1 Tax=Caenorhabditis briggsae TaxID=6238 RepID=A0AAE9A273_CAEBR|nr:hypothetical protein L3Y34_007323 [Caenorhabditis briggsae]